ncbi:chemotaxis protein CheB [Sphingomonas sp. 2R-10]|uniref:chemotaxis protein CheB n=1 Tax=Sphingomonas sp. 2R-10 TaxID=3045148 RepID=UPI000F7A9E9F|nr:chemotaxis protein CheB [Sphingomonas sp. 2R-10]MDJ0277412.1 chemotaxis protein CheB [Sphingomonas sp. 2R-10]
MVAATVRQAAPAEGVLRVLIVDDSAVTRCVLARIVDTLPEAQLVAAVGGIAPAVAVLRERPIDLILLDINLPGTDGLSGLPALFAAAPDARVIILSGECADGSPVALHALALGAAATIAKPQSTPLAGGFATRLATLVADVMRGPVRAAPGSQGDAFDVIAIGASTGGIHALAPLLKAIPPELDVPILVTQHLPGSFTEYFAQQLAALARRPVDVARDSLRIQRGRLIVAPGDAHIRVVPTTEGGAIRLDRSPSSSGCTPSVDPMFDSIAQVYGARALAVVLSGMGRDGCRGAERIRALGGVVAVQDQASSVVWGMPGAIAESGLAHIIGTPVQLGEFIARRKRPA